MKIIIFRTEPSSINMNQYNIQELGLARALVNQGHICDIIFYNGNHPTEIQEYLVENGIIKIYWLQGKSIFNNGFFRDYEHIICNYDVVQVSGYIQYTSMKLYTSKNHKVVLYQGPYVAAYAKGYNLKFKLFNLFFNNKRINKNVPVLTKNKFAADDMQKVGFEKIHVVGVGLNDRLFKEDCLKGNIQKDISCFKLLYIGRIEERRNILFMLQVLKMLRDRGMPVELDIIGGGNESYIEKCKIYMRKENIEEAIHWHGKKQQCELAEFYMRSDLFILPTQYEIFGMVLLEAMYYGLPVISSSNGGADVLIEDDVDGFVRPLDLSIWIECIEQIYKDRDLAAYVGKNAEEKIKNHFLWEHRVPLFLDAYNEALQCGCD